VTVDSPVSQVLLTSTLDVRRSTFMPFVLLVEAGVLDAKRFQAILTRHGLLDRWQQFERQFLKDSK
jgi:hypothetical protein